MDSSFQPATKVVIVVSNECNIKCKHCYLPEITPRSPEDTLEATVSLQNQGYGILIAGGEILLNPDYLKAYEQAGQTYLLTNGILLKQKPGLFDLIRQHGIRQLVFSLHFDIDKGLRSVPEMFVAERIKEAKQKGFTIKVTTVVTPENIADIDTMCERAITYGIDILQFNRFVQMGNDPDTEGYNLSDTQIQRFFDSVMNLRKRFPKELLEIRPNGNFGPRSGSKGDLLARENRYCPAGTGLMAIDSNNLVYGCPFTMRQDAVIGRYTNGKIVIERELLAGKKDTCIAHLLSDAGKGTAR